MSVSEGNSPRRATRDITTAEMCTDSAHGPTITSVRAGHATAVGGLPSTASELAPGDITVARSAAQIRDGVDVDQMCCHITWRCACGALTYGPTRAGGAVCSTDRPTFVSAECPA